jgi:WhiB family redox-sensing transcriptional regulator
MMEKAYIVHTSAGSGGAACAASSSCPDGWRNESVEVVMNFPRGHWRERAACRSEDPELFFPLGEVGLSRTQIERARAVCHRCPVMTACGSWALRNGESDGVWGGMTAAERRALRVPRFTRGDR